MTKTSVVTVHVVPYGNDNYAYILRDKTFQKTALFDCGDVQPVWNFLTEKNWKLDYIFATHYHGDHTAGIGDLVSKYSNAKTIKPAYEERLKDYDIALNDQEYINFGNLKIQAIRVPAHTQHCTAYYIKPFLFVGDALFSVGCGRLFEGMGNDLMKAMDRFSSLPDETQVFFGHEYTLSNINFAKSIEPDNSDLNDYYLNLTENKNLVKTTPTTIGFEKKVNPFLRIDASEIIRKIDLSGNMPRHERIAVLRDLKDRF